MLFISLLHPCFKAPLTIESLLSIAENPHLIKPAKKKSKKKCEKSLTLLELHERSKMLQTHIVIINYGNQKKGVSKFFNQIVTFSPKFIQI